LDERRVYADDPHSFPLSLAASAGIFGVIGLGILLVWIQRRATEIGPDDALAAGFLGGVIAYLLQSLVSVDDLTPRVAFWTVLGGLAATLAARSLAASPKSSDALGTEADHEAGAWRGAVGVVIISIGLIGSFLWSLNWVAADVRVLRGSVLLGTHKIQAGEQQFEGALRFRDEFAYRNLYGLNLAFEAADQEDDSVALELLGKAKVAYSYLEDFPEVDTMLDLAERLRAARDIDPSAAEDSVLLYERALSLDPYDPVVRLAYFDLLRDLERYEDAIPMLEKGLSYSNEGAYKRLWGALALSKAKIGDTEGARMAIDRALPGDPLAREAAALIGDSG
jgi:tetratricopeptide (TPR) repeat protein